MSYIILIAAFNAFFFTALLLQKKKALHDKILIAWLIYLGVYTGAYALFSDSLFTDYHLLSAAFISLLLLHGPLMYFYVSALADQSFKVDRNAQLHFIPFVLFNIYLLASLFLPETSNRIRLDHVETEEPVPVVFNIFLLLTVLSGPVYFVLAIGLFKKLHLNLVNNFSATESRNPEWLKKLVILFGTVWTILIVAAALHHVFHFYTLQFCTDGLFLSLSAFIILVGYFGLRQKEIFIQYPDKAEAYVTEPEQKYAAPLLKENEAEAYIGQLRDLMKQEKPHLEANLTLPELASRMDIPSHHLSRAINEKLGLNFFEFINRYRVEEVKAKLDDPAYENFSLLGIAFESGFNTKSAFNRVFKNLTGMTPGQYKKQIKV
ncbi:MAG TPA: AraC family transcriptional regulator [Mariniphaga sp.]|nr:AraC family transcriptional regulator [Mariniphaga sp.]